MKFKIMVMSLFILSFFASVVQGAGEYKKGAFTISSPVFENKGDIPRKYSCDGRDINPPLVIENIPPGAKSLALIVDDPDAPSGIWVHWVVWNMGPEISGIREGSLPQGAIEGVDDFRENKYRGPCPPSGVHRYYFKLYALDTLLNLNPGSGKQALEKAMKGHIISQAQITGLYRRNR